MDLHQNQLYPNSSVSYILRSTPINQVCSTATVTARAPHQAMGVRSLLPCSSAPTMRHGRHAAFFCPHPWCSPGRSVPCPNPNRHLSLPLLIHSRHLTWIHEHTHQDACKFLSLRSVLAHEILSVFTCSLVGLGAVSPRYPAASLHHPGLSTAGIAHIVVPLQFQLCEVGQCVGADGCGECCSSAIAQRIAVKMSLCSCGTLPLLSASPTATPPDSPSALL